YYISPTQLDVQVPSGVSGTVPVTVTYNGATTASFNATVAPNAPALFAYPSGSNTFAAATHASGQTIGDPAVTPGSSKAAAGETIVLYVNGVASSPSGVLINAPISYSAPVTVSVGTATGTVVYAALTLAGVYQLNVVLPSGLAAGTYPIGIQTAGQTSQTGVLLPVGP
ncbi:MAG TPA: hypothetical protein VFC21_08070, partial [Bryobacteraceae bacterium]|nr:hypothetical protein [Bryobacteraceae bacterium]